MSIWAVLVNVDRENVRLCNNKYVNKKQTLLFYFENLYFYLCTTSEPLYICWCLVQLNIWEKKKKFWLWGGF